MDYKGAGSLDKSKGKKGEISKDISAFANSDGGVIIYGVREFDDAEKNHLPEKIDPINGKEFSKEWLEQVINSTISPKIHNIIITPIQVRDKYENSVIYVVEIPKSNTAHQMKDKRYYRRYNFQSIAMEDWEIRDVMNRGTKANIRIKLKSYPNKIEVVKKINSNEQIEIRLRLIATNNSANASCHYLSVYVSSKSLNEEWFFEAEDWANFKGESSFFHKVFTNKEKDNDSSIRIPILPRTQLDLGSLIFSSNMLLKEKDCEIQFQISTENSVRKVNFDLKSFFDLQE